jgi:hypothetical protein
MLDDATFDDRLDLFHSAPSPDRVTVYARLREPPADGRYALRGTIRGPHCLYSTTLQTTADFKDAGPGETLLAKALVVDPCYWTPELPFLYDVEVELLREGKVTARARREFGMRDLAVRGRFLYLNGKRFVPRGVTSWQLDRRFPTVDAAVLHDEGCVVFAQEISEAFFATASRLGVFVILEIDPWLMTQRRDEKLPDADLPVVAPDMEFVAAVIRRLARHPSVAIAAVINSFLSRPFPFEVAPQLIPAASLGNVEDLQELSSNFQAVVLRIYEAPSAEMAAALQLPAIMFDARPSIDDEENQASLISEARAKADRFQADLAPYGDFAGYIV